MLMIEYSPIFSGHGIYLEKLIPKLLGNGCSIDIIAGDFNRLPPESVIHGVKIHRIKYSPGEKNWEIKLSFRVIRFLVKNRNYFDVLHLHGHLDIYGLLTLACKFLGKKIIMQMVLMGTDDPLSLNKCYKLMNLRWSILKQIDHFIHISEPIGKSCRAVGIRDNKMMCIRQGVDTDLFAPVTREEKVCLRRERNLPEGQLIVTFVGAIIHRKGIDILLDAWEKIQETNRDILLLLVGPYKFEHDENRNNSELDDYVRGIFQQIENNHLNVRFVGFAKDIPQYLKLSDIFVLPSRKEGFGNVIIEAMACGIPPVVAHMDGVSTETVTDGVTGYVFRNTTELGERLKVLIGDSTMREAIGRSARADVEGRFKLDDIAREYVSVYRGVMT